MAGALFNPFSNAPGYGRGATPKQPPSSPFTVDDCIEYIRQLDLRLANAELALTRHAMLTRPMNYREHLIEELAGELECADWSDIEEALTNILRALAPGLEVERIDLSAHQENIVQQFEKEYREV